MLHIALSQTPGQWLPRQESPWKQKEVDDIFMFGHRVPRFWGFITCLAPALSWEQRGCLTRESVLRSEALKRRLGTLLFSGMSSYTLRPQPSLSAQRTLPLAQSSETVHHPASSACHHPWDKWGCCWEFSLKSHSQTEPQKQEAGLVAVRELEEEKSGVTVFRDGSAGKESACNGKETQRT